MSGTSGSAPAADQYRCTEALLEITPEVTIIANLGTASNILHDIADRDQHFYMTGAMGGTTALGVGVAVSTDEPVTVLEGDGSLLMSMGVLGTVGRYNLPNLVIVVWENKAFSTTGGQTTQAEVVDIAGVARDCNVHARSVDTVEAFEDAYAEAMALDESAVIVCEVEPVDFHATYELDLNFTKRRFKQALSDQ